MPKFRGKCGCKPTPLTSDAGLRTRLAVPEGRAKAQANREEEVWSWRRFSKIVRGWGPRSPKTPKLVKIEKTRAMVAGCDQEIAIFLFFVTRS